MDEHCLYILCGLPFAGKTTLTRALERKLGFALVELDAINLEENKSAKKDQK